MGVNRDGSIHDSKIRSNSFLRAPRGEVSQQLINYQETENAKLSDKCEETLETQKIRKETYWSGIDKTKNILLFRIQNVVGKHIRNLTELNALLSENFELPLIDCENETGRAGRIRLDDVIRSSKNGATLSWRWARNSKPSDQNSIMARIKTLIEERKFIDKHLLINNSVDKSLGRQEATTRLEKLSKDPSKTDRSLDFIVSSSEREDQLALFRFFETYINLNLPSDCENLKIRSFYSHNFSKCVLTQSSRN